MSETIPIGTMDIGLAVHAMEAGHCVARAGWNGPGQFLALQTPDENSKMTLPYIYISTVQGDLVPWLASQTDILARDWITVDVQVPAVYGAVSH